MLIMPFTLLDVNYAMLKINVLSPEKPGFRWSHACAEEQAVENGKGDLLQSRGKIPPGFMGITPAEQVVKLLVRKVMRYILPPVPFLWKYGWIQQAQPAAVQILDAAYNNLYASTARTVLLCVTFPTPAVYHLLCQGRSFWKLIPAVFVKRSKVLSRGIGIPFV